MKKDTSCWIGDIETNLPEKFISSDQKYFYDVHEILMNRLMNRISGIPYFNTWILKSALKNMGLFMMINSFHISDKKILGGQFEGFVLCDRDLYRFSELLIFFYENTDTSCKNAVLFWRNWMRAFKRPSKICFYKSSFRSSFKSSFKSSLTNSLGTNPDLVCDCRSSYEYLKNIPPDV